MEQAERERYFHFLNGLDKIERMLESSDSLTHRRVIHGYWLRLKEEGRELGLGLRTEEARRVIQVFDKMVVKMRWQYHPRYCPNGTKWLNQKGLSRFWKGGLK